MDSKHLSEGFTLLELILSIGILAVLIVLAGNLANSTAATTAAVRLRLEADNQARAVFDRMSLDFSGMLNRKDVDAVFLKQNGNDKMFFYSETPAYYSSDPVASKRSSLALVGYRINSKFELERLGKGLTWDGAPYSSTGGSLNFLTYPNGSSHGSPLAGSTIFGRWQRTIGDAPSFSGVDRDYHTLSSHVCRMELCFQLKPAEATAKTCSINPFYPEHAHIHGIQDVSAILVTIALTNPSSQQNASYIEHLAAALPDPAELDLHADPPEFPAALWRSKISSFQILQKAGIASAAISRMRIYERCFYLNPR